MTFSRGVAAVSVWLLAHGVAAQSTTSPPTSGSRGLCMMETDFRPDHPMFIEEGIASWTCQEMVNKYADHFTWFSDSQSQEVCYSQVDWYPKNLTGVKRMTFAQAQAYMTSKGGCCGDEGSPSYGSFGCADYVEWGEDCPDEYCFGQGGCHQAFPQEIDDGVYMCAPCYDRIVEYDGRPHCTSCWVLEPYGCHEQECDEFGAWNAEHGHCGPCSKWESSGCGESECHAKGHKYQCHHDWNHDWCECRACKPEEGDIEVCEEHECLAENGHFWKCHGEHHCYCAKCEVDHHWDCPQDQCHGSDESGSLVWFCHDERGEHCNCAKCDPTGHHDWVGYCPEDMCHHPLLQDVKFIEELGHNGRCARCANEEHHSFHDGCISRGECEGVIGFEWSCEEDHGLHCCHPCTADQVWGCRSPESCSEAGGNWKCWDESCSHGECRSCRPEHNDIHGCNEDQCNENLDHHWLCHQHGCECRHCDVDHPWGCPEHRCLAEDDNYMTCRHGDCWCGKCNVWNEDGGWYGACPEEICNAHDHLHWARFEYDHYYHETGHHEKREYYECVGCFDKGEHARSYQCPTRQSCEDSGFFWDSSCQEWAEVTEGCCQPCHDWEFWGCPNKEMCEQFEHSKWCSSYCTWEWEECKGGPDPKCGLLGADHRREFEAHGLEVASCVHHY